MKNKKLLVHIDYGSVGNSGLYIRETLLNIKNHLYDKNLLIVQKNFEYSAPGMFKIFNYFGYNFKGRLLKIYKFFDLAISLFVTTVLILKERNYDKVVVLSLNTPFIHYKVFARVLKSMDLKLYCILHDIVELSIDAPSAIIVDRMDILTLADGFICHTEESYDYAKNISDNVYKYRFPLMKITDNPEQVLSSQFDQHHERNEIKFLFIGGLRPEKGVQLLIDSFTGILNANIEQKISLTIAGKSIPGMTFHSTSSDIKIIDKYISDHEFLFLISEADYVVLPYLEGTNSGILSTVSSTLTPVIASNLPMFVESSFIAKNNLFEKASLDSLSELLLSKINNYSESKQVDDLFIYQSVANYEESFKVELNECYAEILK